MVVVLVPGRLVEHGQPGRQHQRPGQRGALLLAERGLGDRAVGQLARSRLEQPRAGQLVGEPAARDRRAAAGSATFCPHASARPSSPCCCGRAATTAQSSSADGGVAVDGHRAASGTSKPAARWHSAVLPEPDGPATQTTSPASTCSETSSSTSDAVGAVAVRVADAGHGRGPSRRVRRRPQGDLAVAEAHLGAAAGEQLERLRRQLQPARSSR